MKAKMMSQFLKKKASIIVNGWLRLKGNDENGYFYGRPIEFEVKTYEIEYSVSFEPTIVVRKEESGQWFSLKTYKPGYTLTWNKIMIKLRISASLLSIFSKYGPTLSNSQLLFFLSIDLGLPQLELFKEFTGEEKGFLLEQIEKFRNGFFTSSQFYSTMEQDFRFRNCLEQYIFF